MARSPSSALVAEVLDRVRLERALARAEAEVALLRRVLEDNRGRLRPPQPDAALLDGSWCGAYAPAAFARAAEDCQEAGLLVGG